MFYYVSGPIILPPFVKERENRNIKHVLLEIVLLCLQTNLVKNK